MCIGFPDSRRAIVDDLVAKKLSWVGPGTAIALDGANLWVYMLCELWKAAREQCRSAIHDERAGVEAILRECQDLVQEEAERTSLTRRNPERRTSV